MARRTPELNLTPELPEVVSQDFNLFFKPEVAPVDESVIKLTQAMDNFVNDAGTKMVISSERKLKKEEVAKAERDYIENKKKFRDAVKDGTIDKTANPYYIEHYKNLTLNEYANQFIDKLGKRYKELGVVENLTEGAFNNFYKSELESFIKENQLGQFEATELEKGFFKETSSYRAILENNHRQSQLKLFDDRFNEKVDTKIYGIFEKFKDFENSPVGDFDDGVSKYQFLADKIQNEISAILDVNPNADITDRVLQGIEKYITTTRDYEYAKEIISNLPKFLQGGTGSFGDIGKVRMKQEELMTLLIQNQELKEGLEVKLKETQDKKEFVNTYTFLEENINNENFNILEYRNDSSRTIAEVQAIDTFIKNQQFDGGNSDNTIVMNDIATLLDEGKFNEAETLAQKALASNQIRKSTYTTLITADIPNYRNFKDKPVFSNEIYQSTITGLNQVLASATKYGDKINAGQAKSYINKRMLRWYKSNVANEQYFTNGKLDENKFEQGFLQEFSNIIEVMKTATYPDGAKVFPALEFSNSKSYNQVETTLDGFLNKK